MARDISNSDDVIDSRDVIKRIDELTSERDDLQEAIDDAQQATPQDEHAIDAQRAAREALADWNDDYAEELAALVALQEQAGYSEDWQHGATLIRESYFEDYAQQLAEDIGAIDPKKSYGWPLDCIDWEQAARELQQDYTSVEYDGITYWVR